MNTLTNFNLLEFDRVLVVVKGVECLASTVKMVFWLLDGLGGIPKSLTLVFPFPFFFSGSLAFLVSLTRVAISC